MAEVYLTDVWCVYARVSHTLVNEVRPATSIYCTHTASVGLPQWLRGKESTRNAGDTGHAGSIPGSGRSPRGGHDNPLQYSCLDSPMDREAWRATVHRVAKSETRLKLLHTLARTDVAKFFKVLI